jgi:hypothetical protein
MLSCSGVQEERVRILDDRMAYNMLFIDLTLYAAYGILERSGQLLGVWLQSSLLAPSYGPNETTTPQGANLPRL